MKINLIFRIFVGRFEFLYFAAFTWAIGVTVGPWLAVSKWVHVCH